MYRQLYCSVFIAILSSVASAGQFSLVESLSGGPAGADTWFGWGIASEGTIMAVAAQRDDEGAPDAGAVFIFERRSNGTWEEFQKLIAPDPGVGDWFGTSVDISESRIAVGARNEDDCGSDCGAVYLYERFSGGPWGLVVKLLPSQGGPGDLFGRHLAFDNQTLLVGAESDDTAGADSGAVYVFEKIAGTWTETQVLRPSDPSNGAGFGRYLDIDGDTAVVGAYFDDDLGPRSGSAYIFTRDSSGVWLETVKLLPSDGSSHGEFGRSLSLDGDRVAIGSPYTQVPNPGAVHVFERDAGGANNWGRSHDSTFLTRFLPILSEPLSA